MTVELAHLPVMLTHIQTVSSLFLIEDFTCTVYRPVHTVMSVSTYTCAMCTYTDMHSEYFS
jgi:hypothetical protein